jgi:hypothetical protein
MPCTGVVRGHQDRSGSRSVWALISCIEPIAGLVVVKDPPGNVAQRVGSVADHQDLAVVGQPQQDRQMAGRTTGVEIRRIFRRRADELGFGSSRMPLVWSTCACIMITRSTPSGSIPNVQRSLPRARS